MDWLEDVAKADPAELDDAALAELFAETADAVGPDVAGTCCCCCTELLRITSFQPSSRLLDDEFVVVEDEADDDA